MKVANLAQTPAGAFLWCLNMACWSVRNTVRRKTSTKSAATRVLHLTHKLFLNKTSDDMATMQRVQAHETSPAWLKQLHKCSDVEAQIKTIAPYVGMLLANPALIFAVWGVPTRTSEAAALPLPKYHDVTCVLPYATACGVRATLRHVCALSAPAIAAHFMLTRTQMSLHRMEARDSLSRNMLQINRASYHKAMSAWLNAMSATPELCDNAHIPDKLMANLVQQYLRQGTISAKAAKAILTRGL